MCISYTEWVSGLWMEQTPGSLAQFFLSSIGKHLVHKVVISKSSVSAETEQQFKFQ